MRSSCNRPRWSATTGVAGRPASQRRCGRSACTVLSRWAATTSRTSLDRLRHCRRFRSIASGISIIFIASADAGLQANRRKLCRLLWQLWSPNWHFDDVTFERSAASFDNPDFVDVVIHSYRHRSGLVTGDPQYDELEARIAEQPPITVPTVVLESGADGVGGPSAADPEERAPFTGPYQHRLLPGIGHNVPQEAPAEFAAAVLDLV